MSIGALVKGTVSGLQAALTNRIPVGERYASGAPHGAYKRPSGWFVGVYYAGMVGQSSSSFEVTYSLNVDVTRVVPQLRSAARGPELYKDQELFHVLGKITEFMCSAAGKIAVACNTALAGTAEDGQGVFREQFHTFSAGQVRSESPDWILGVPGEADKDGPILVAPMRFEGLKWRKLLSALWVGDQ